MRKRGTRPSIILRRATPTDLSVLAEQRLGMLRAMGHRPGRALACHARVFSRWARPLMASGRLVGFLAETLERPPVIVAGGLVWIRSWQPHPALRTPHVPYLLNVYTDPAWRGFGLATRITKAAMRWAQARRYPHMILHASPDGRRLYRRLGWKRTWEMKIPL